MNATLARSATVRWMGPFLSVWLLTNHAFAAEQAAQAPSAQPPSVAEQRFNEGLALLRAGDLAAACPKLEESVRLDPAPGAKFRLGECYEGLGRLAAAYRMFREVEADTRVEDTVEREQQVRAKLDELEKRVAWLVVRAPESVRTLPGFTISYDGFTLSAEDLRASRVPVDVGAHTFVVAATGHAPFERTITTTLAEPATLAVPVLEKLPDAQPVTLAPPTTPAAEPSTITTGRVVSLVLFGASVAALAPGVALGAVALSDWDDALARCEGGDRTRCPDDAIADGAAAYELGVVSTALWIGAGAFAAGGLVLWLATPPDEVGASVAVQPTALGAGAVLTMRGGFR